MHSITEFLELVGLVRNGFDTRRSFLTALLNQREGRESRWLSSARRRSSRIETITCDGDFRRGALSEVGEGFGVGGASGFHPLRGLRRIDIRGWHKPEFFPEPAGASDLPLVVVQ